MVEKADMVKVEARIDRKYQDVVAYLNEAIKVAGEDEVGWRPCPCWLHLPLAAAYC